MEMRSALQIVIVCILTSVTSVCAQAPAPALGPETALHPHIGLGQFGWDAPEVATAYPTSVNPAAMALLWQLRFLKLERTGEVDASQTWFDCGLAIDSVLYSYLRSDKHHGMWRVSWFGFGSNRAPVQFLPEGQQAQMRGEELAVSYAKQLPRTKWRVGATVSPYTRSWVRAYSDNQMVGDGATQGAEVILGAQYLANKHLTLGATQRYQYVSSSLGARRENYHAYATTVGAEWKPELNGRATYVIDMQYAAVRGPGVRENDILPNGGVNYHVSGRWTANVSTNYAGLTYGRDYDLYAGITWTFANRSLADRHLGRSSMVMLWMTKSQ